MLPLLWRVVTSRRERDSLSLSLESRGENNEYEWEAEVGVRVRIQSRPARGGSELPVPGNVHMEGITVRQASLAE